MAVDNDQLLDLIATTLKDLPQGQFEAMWDSQHFEAAAIYSKERRKVDGGTSIQRNVVLDETGNARYRKLFDVDTPVVNNVQRQIEVPWVQFSTNYSWDVLEIMRNKNSTKGYIDLMETRKLDAMWSMAELFEDRLWKTPTSATDKLYPNGVPYYLNHITSGSTTAGFVGQTIYYQDGTTGTACAGLDAALEPKWRNYADIYTKVDNALLRKMRKAMLLTRFRPPATVRAPGDDKPGTSAKIYCDADRAVELMDLADKRDDNNTAEDLAGKVLVDVEGATYFNRRPIVYVPQLDSFTITSSNTASQPIFFVDWSKIQPIVQDGYWMVESKPMMDRLQHTTVTVYNDSCHQNLCTNRRTAGWVMHLAI